MDRAHLSVSQRDIIGKKVKQLRKNGVVPAHIYGYKTDPINISVDAEQLREVYRNSGDTGLVDLKLGSDVHPVLIKDIQIHPITGAFLNADFHKVNLKEKVTVSVPVVAIGEPEAEANKIGLLVQPVLEVEIEALPTDLIENIEVPVEHLKDLDEAIYVKDLSVPATVTILTDPETMVFKIDVAEMPEVVEEEPAAAEGEEGETEGEEGVEGEEKAQEDGEASEESADDSESNDD